ncbi:MAG: hypothetical protein U0746_01625 [Gemmataceae bacterium]
MKSAWFCGVLILVGGVAFVRGADPTYTRGATRVATIVATLRANGLPALDGVWHVIGPFDNTDGDGFDRAYPPEREIDFKKTYPGKRGAMVAWVPFEGFALAKLNNLARGRRNSDNSCCYLLHEFEAATAVELPVSFGSDDTLSVWFNGKRLIHENYTRPAAPDQDRTVLSIKPGKNRLLVKVCNGGGQWELYVCPALPTSWPVVVHKQLERDFPGGSNPSISTADTSAEARHYRIVTITEPSECVLEVGGLGFRPDGSLLACTRRGEIWRIVNPGADDPIKTKFELFASGLHEALGLHVVDDRTVYVVQRPELTKVVDRDGDGRADEFRAVCDAFGVSGDYHEFAFGPAVDAQGNFYLSLNVGFGGGHQSKSPWRGWCVKVNPNGTMTPYATGLRSPNGINISPDGDLFYCDNQGEWVATNKLHHVRPGEFYGHPAGLRWLKDSPFAGKFPEKPISGMLYDGQPGASGVGGMPNLTPPCVWFPYTKMGQSASEPRWDTTAGKFGPFAGQIFVGDQTKSMVMRVVLENVNGRYQGACIPFRSGFQCGINRLVFGPDGKLYAGQTNRGWGSVGGRSQGLQRLEYTGALPFEIHTVKLTRDGFDLAFTKPVDAMSAEAASAVSVASHTYNYWSTYGSPEVDVRAETVSAVKLGADARTLSFSVAKLRPGRVYSIHLTGVRSTDGQPVLHSDAYYTINDLR